MSTDFFRNIAKLFSANVIAGVVGLAFYPVLTRLYEPADFGLLSLFSSIVGVLVILSTADLQYAIMLPKDNSQANAVAHNALICTVCVVAVTLLSGIFAKPIANLFNAEGLAKIWWLIPIMVLICAVWNIANYHFTRNKSFSYISAYLLTQGTLIPVFKLIFALAGATVGGLIYGSVAGAAIAVCAVMLTAITRNKITLIPSSALERKQALHTFRRFPIFSLPRSVINNLSSNIPSLLLTPFFGLAPIGLFSIGLTFGFRPVNMLENSVYQVFFQQISQSVNQRQPIMPTIRKFVRYTLLILAPLTIAGLLLLSYLTGWLLGNEWVETGHYLRILLPWLVTSLFVAPICFLSDIFQKQPQALGFEILLISCRIIGMAIGIWTDNFSLSVLGYSIGGAIAITAQFIWYMTLAKSYDSSLTED